MTHSISPPLHRLLERCETTALLEEFQSLVPGVSLALIRPDGHLFVSTGDWSQVDLQEAACRIQDIGSRRQEIEDMTTEASTVSLSGGHLPAVSSLWGGTGSLYPLPAGPYLAGALVTYGPGSTDPRQEQALRYLHRILTTLITRSVEKRALARETLERYREISLLYDLGETIIACLDVQALPERVMQEGSRIIRNDAGAVFMVNPASGELELQASHSLTPGDVDRGGQLTPTRLAYDAASKAVTEGLAYMDNELPPATLPGTNDERREEICVRALLSAPLKTRDRVLGAIVLLRGNEKGMFTAGEEKLLNALATQTAIALENARLYALVGQALKRREGQLSTVEEIARELNATLNLRHILDLVVRRCLEATGTERGAIALVDSEIASAADLHVVSAHGFEGGLPSHLQQLARHVIETRQAMTARLRSPDAAAGAHLVVPILLENRPMGVIVLASSPGALDRRMRSEDEAFIGHLAAHAATAIHNARLYEAEQQARSAAEQERSKLAAILTGTSEAIIVTDEQQRVLLFNPAAQAFFNAPPSNVIGYLLDEVVVETGLVDLLRRAARQGHALTEQVAGPGDTTFYAGVSPVAGIGWVVVMQDISYLKELDALRSEFVSTASHDLKNPIGVVMGYAGLIAELGELNEMQKQCLDQIMKTSRGMTRLINDLLDIVRIEAGFLGQMERCSLGAIVQEVVSQLRHQARAKKIVLRERIPRRLAPVMGNPHRLIQVITNLVDNAIKYTPDNGRISVTVRSRKGEMTVKVEDNGIGIASEDLEHMFERFHRASEAERLGIEGTGLGLSICRSIVEKHGGRIWVESEKGRGSAFYFTLPAVGAQSD